jgi:hypothetical protein
VELGKYGIKVNAVAPGPTQTPMTARNLDHDEYRQLVIDTTPLGKVGTPELLSNGIVGLLTMDWGTGQVLVVDGGSSLVTPRSAKRVLPSVRGGREVRPNQLARLGRRLGSAGAGVHTNRIYGQNQ